MIRRALSIILLLLASSSFAAIDTFEFSSDDDRQRFRQLSEELRCPKCQNQNLAGSDAAIALDLRTQLHLMITQGHSNKEIKDFMVERYGEFILYEPSVNSLTYVLWYGPFVLLFFGFVVVFCIARNRKRGNREAQLQANQVQADAQQLEHQKRLQELLGKRK